MVQVHVSTIPPTKTTSPVTAVAAGRRLVACKPFIPFTHIPAGTHWETARVGPDWLTEARSCKWNYLQLDWPYMRQSCFNVSWVGPGLGMGWAAVKLGPCLKPWSCCPEVSLGSCNNNNNNNNLFPSRLTTFTRNVMRIEFKRRTIVQLYSYTVITTLCNSSHAPYFLIFYIQVCTIFHLRRCMAMRSGTLICPPWWLTIRTLNKVDLQLF